MKLSPKCVWIVDIFCDKSVTKIQQVLLGIFTGPLKLLKILAKSSGSAGARTPDHLIKSQIATVNQNKAQLIKDVISVRCVINNKLQYCTFLCSSAKNLQHYRPYHPLWGIPLLCYLERDTSPKKIQLTLNNIELQ